MAWTKDPTLIKHTCNDGYGPNFGRLTANCPRCEELKSGAAPRKWNTAFVDTTFKERLRNHNCESSNCGPICTAFDW
jgi:hypothetical protein